jgi:hypothetical protein
MLSFVESLLGELVGYWCGGISYQGILGEANYAMIDKNHARFLETIPQKPVCARSVDKLVGSGFRYRRR